jgi:hypothetical protein
MNIRSLLLCATLAALSLDAAAATPAASSPAKASSAASRVDATFGAWDTNKDRMLSLAEFEAGWAGLERATMVEMRLRQQFHAVDADKSGALESGEYANLVLVKRAGKAAPPLSAFDANKDQRLQFAEYLDLVRKLGTRPGGSGK